MADFTRAQFIRYCEYVAGASKGWRIEYKQTPEPTLAVFFKMSHSDVPTERYRLLWVDEEDGRPSRLRIIHRTGDGWRMVAEDFRAIICFEQLAQRSFHEEMDIEFLLR